MRISMGFEQRQQQVQKLAPRMIQSMEILQLPVIALQERIEQEMNENPLLEVQEQDPQLPEEPVDTPERSEVLSAKRRLLLRLLPKYFFRAAVPRTVLSGQVFSSEFRWPCNGADWPDADRVIFLV